MVAPAIIGVALPLALAAPAAGALNCGQTIAKSVMLKKDLIDCPGDGLVVGATGITVDLNGHRIDGVKAAGSAGIANGLPAFADVVVKGGGNGRITGFGTGVEIFDAADGAVRGIAIKNAGRGVTLNGADRTKVRNNRISEIDGYGLSIVNNADQNQVLDNEITGPVQSPLTSAGFTVSAFSADDNVIRSNVVRGGVDGDVGIWVFGDAQGTRIRANLFKGMSGTGIQVYNSSDDTLVKNNTANRNGLDGIAVLNDTGTGTQVIGNRVRFNSSDGIEINDSGVAVGGNLAVANGAWGILATAAISDLGGNKAAGNGQSAQCSGVACTPP
jgi:parallel beta-helix repeat protein